MTMAKEISLEKLLEFHPGQGEISLKDRRMIISSADAWGTLRKDLIAALGLERAKRFLLRYGWNCGLNDARNLKRMFDFHNDKEWLLAGAQMHNISGNVLSLPGKVEIDRKKGTFYFEGAWINSFEAQQHLMHFSQHHEPVCYILIGYAGGYATEFMGKKVIFKETECAATGDTHCRFVGKTIEEWGEEIRPELALYEEQTLADELDVAYTRIERQTEILKQGYRLSQKLTQIVLQGKGLDAIAKVLGETLQCKVNIVDSAYQRLAAYGEFETVEALTESLSSKEKDIFKRLHEERCTVEIGNRLISPVVLRNRISGFVSIAKQSGVFGDLETVSLERTATVCAIQMLNEQTAIETEQRSKGELLDELLLEEIDTPQITRRMAYYGYGMNTPYHVFMFQLDKSCEEMQGEEAIDLRKKIISYLSEDLERAGFKALVSARIDRVYALVPEKFFEIKKQKVKEYGHNIINSSSEASQQTKVILGISSLCTNLTDFAHGYHEAQKAIEIAGVKWKEQRVILASELGHLGILLNARNPKELESFARNKLGILYDYDQKNDSELLKTLYFYIENEFNLHKTAREMNVSISGMRYRLRRIQEVSKIDLNLSSTRFEVQLAIEIFVVMGLLMI